MVEESRRREFQVIPHFLFQWTSFQMQFESAHDIGTWKVKLGI